MPSSPVAGLEIRRDSPPSKGDDGKSSQVSQDSFYPGR
jgi:hypothetical protein